MSLILILENSKNITAAIPYITHFGNLAIHNTYIKLSLISEYHYINYSWYCHEIQFHTALYKITSKSLKFKRKLKKTLWNRPQDGMVANYWIMHFWMPQTC